MLVLYVHNLISKPLGQGEKEKSFNSLPAVISPRAVWLIR